MSADYDLTIVVKKRYWWMRLQGGVAGLLMIAHGIVGWIHAFVDPETLGYPRHRSNEISLQDGLFCSRDPHSSISDPISTTC